MKNLPYDEIGNLTTLLHKTNGTDHIGNDYIYSVTIYPSAETCLVHVNRKLFRKLVDCEFDFEVTCYDKERFVHVSATCQNMTFATCVQSCDLITSEDDNSKSTSCLYQEFCEREDWPYVQTKQA